MKTVKIKAFNKKKELKVRVGTEHTNGSLIILGMGTSRIQCPFDTEVWAVNTGYKQVAEMGGHLEKLFLAHTQCLDHEGDIIFDWEEINKLADAGVDVLNIHRVKGLSARMFPMERLIKKFGCDYFSDTICYMMVYAIDQGYKKLRLYGIDMHLTDEYQTEKGGIEYWIGYARGLGIDVWIVDGGSLLRTVTGKPYGIKFFKMKDIDPFGLLKRKQYKKMSKLAKFTISKTQEFIEETKRKKGENAITQGSNGQ